MNIYVSSTSQDLCTFRAAVVDQLVRLGHRVVSMEGYTADARGPVEKCLADVASAEVYIGLFAFHYGSVPSGYEHSVTELEFRKACERGIPRLIFLVPEDVDNWPVRFIDRGQASVPMQRFREELSAQQGFTLAFFKDSTELLQKLPQAIKDILQPANRGSRVSQESFRDRVKPLSFEAEKSKHLAHFTGRQWVEQRLDKWITEQPDSRVFCLLGGPGIGKSAIACHWCHTRNDVIAFHYCVYGHAEKTNPKRILLSLAAQIAAHLPAYAQHLSGIEGSELEEIVHGDARTVFDNLLLRPLCGNVAAPGRVHMVVVDALDEATRGQDNELARFIGEVWGGLPDWLRLVVTSRPEMDVTDYLGNLHPFILNASSRENLQDVRTFLRRGLDAQEADDEVINQLVEKSEGMFLYAYLILDEIRARRLSLQEIADFPEGLTGYFRAWFGRKFPDCEAYHRDFHQLVSAIVAQKAPLPLNTLSSALSVSPWELDQRLNVLGVLFPLREERQGNQKQRFVTLMHKSLHDWLTELDPESLRRRAGSFAADPDLGNRLLAEEGWKVYSAGRLPQHPYFMQTLLPHVAEAQQTERLASILLDPRLIDTLWSNEFRYEWQHHISHLRHTLSLPNLVQDWVGAHCATGTASTRDAVVAGKLGRLFQEMGAFDEAMLLATAALQIWETHNVVDSPDMVSSLLAMGRLQSGRDELESATTSYEKALAIARRAYAPNSPQMADVFYQLCIFYTKGKRDYPKASDCREKALAIYSGSTPPNYAGMANCINDEAVILDAQNKAGDYLEIYQEALAMFEKARPEGHPEMVATLGNIGLELRKRDKEAEAVEVLRRAVALAERILLPQHEYSNSARVQLVYALFGLHRYDEALEVMRSYVAELERYPGPEHDDTIAARVGLASVLRHAVYLSDSAKRDDYREEAREQCQRIRRAGPDAVLTLLAAAEAARRAAEPGLCACFLDAARRGCSNNLSNPRNNPADSVAAACFAHVLELLVSGAPLAELAARIVTLWEEAEPQIKHQADCLPKTRKLVVSLLSWAGRTRLVRDDDVESVHHAFDLVTRIGAESPETLDQLASLAVSLHDRHHEAISESLCQRLLEISERVLSPEHVQTLTYLANLAHLRMHQGTVGPNDEQTLLRRAYESSCRILGPEHTDTISRASSLIACLLRKRDIAAAHTLFSTFAERLPRSESATSARNGLALCLNRRAIELKDEFAEYQAASACYELSLEMDPKNATTCCNLALLLWSCLNDYPGAAARFEQALKLNPSSGHIHSTYAMFLTHTERAPQRALEHFEESMRLAPTENHISGNFATWCVLTGNLPKGWQLAKRSMQLCLPSPDRVMVRPLFCAAAILFLRQHDASIPLGQMRALFAHGINHVAWIITALLDELDRSLPAATTELLRAVCAGIGDKKHLQRLEDNSAWRAVQPVTFDTPWPELSF